MGFRVFALTTMGCLSACLATPNAPTPSEITYGLDPAEEGAFPPIDIVLDIEALTYATPHNDGYGTYRFDGTNICFWASYSDRERCIDYETEYANWSEGDVWEISSFDGTRTIVTVKSVK